MHPEPGVICSLASARSSLHGTWPCSKRRELSHIARLSVRSWCRAVHCGQAQHHAAAGALVLVPNQYSYAATCRALRAHLAPRRAPRPGRAPCSGQRARPAPAPS